MGGLALQMERSITVGDWVRVGDTEGVVREIRWRQTSVETRNGDTVVFPNGALMKSQVTVLGRRRGKPKLHRMWVNFTVDLRFPPGNVIDAVQAALREDAIPNVATDPKPDCILEDFKPSSGGYAVRYWIIDPASDGPTSSEVRTRILAALLRNNMVISIPTYNVLTTKQSRARDTRLQQEELEQRTRAIAHIKVLEPLTEPERAELAAKLTVAPFRRGEVITRQGNEAHYLYVIVAGSVMLQVQTNGESREVGRLTAPEVVGEMGLLTGAPRTATVIALTDVTCYRLDKTSFNEVLHRRPEIAEAISRLLLERKIRLETITSGMTRERSTADLHHTQNDLLQKIRKFFTLG